MSAFFQTRAWCNHWLLSVDEHSIHSPYFFEFYQKVILSQSTENFQSIEQQRVKFLHDPTPITIEDLGAPSAYFNSQQRTVKEVARTSLAPASMGRFLYRIAMHMQAKSIVELGTCLGITTRYLARPQAHVTTFEGNADLIRLAKQHLTGNHPNQITVIEGNINATLPAYLQTPTKIDLVVMDANHRLEPTLRYFEWLTKRIASKGIIVIDDIYHSSEMAQAWKTLRHHELVYGSVDLFRCGLLFFDPALNRQHYTWTLRESH